MMPPGPGMLNAVERSWLKDEISKMSEEDQVLARKVQERIYELRTTPMHCFALTLTFAFLAFINRSITLGSIATIVSIVLPIVYKKIKRKSILQKLTRSDQERVREIFPKDF